MDATFDPFNDRMARDIRNSLSAALISDLGSATGATVEQAAAVWIQKELPPVCREYIRQTLERYRHVADQIRSDLIQDPGLQALVLWNAGLFFELHELLETVWRVAEGADRTALKGLIQAAGVYVHQLRGNAAAAGGLAQRARRNLLAGRDRLAFVADIDRLIQGLENPAQPPPVLRTAKK
jgi:hypothetical protein